jgi:hypothetical protein
MTAIEIAAAIMETSEKWAFKFNEPPYEYEFELMPFDILAGDNLTRKALLNGTPLTTEYKRWADETEIFRKEFFSISLYKEK